MAVGMSRSPLWKGCRIPCRSRSRQSSTLAPTAWRAGQLEECLEACRQHFRIYILSIMHLHSRACLLFEGLCSSKYVGGESFDILKMSHVASRAPRPPFARLRSSGRDSSVRECTRSTKVCKASMRPSTKLSARTYKTSRVARERHWKASTWARLSSFGVRVTASFGTSRLPGALSLMDRTSTLRRRFIVSFE